MTNNSKIKSLSSQYKRKLRPPLNGFHLKTKSIYVAWLPLPFINVLPSLNAVTNQIIFPFTQTVIYFKLHLRSCVIMISVYSLMNECKNLYNFVYDCVVYSLRHHSLETTTLSLLQNCHVKCKICRWEEVGWEMKVCCLFRNWSGKLSQHVFMSALNGDICVKAM